MVDIENVKPELVKRKRGRPKKVQTPVTCNCEVNNG